MSLQKGAMMDLTGRCQQFVEKARLGDLAPSGGLLDSGEDPLVVVGQLVVDSLP